MVEAVKNGDAVSPKGEDREDVGVDEGQVAAMEKHEIEEVRVADQDEEPAIVIGPDTVKSVVNRRQKTISTETRTHRQP